MDTLLSILSIVEPLLERFNLWGPKLGRVLLILIGLLALWVLQKKVTRKIVQKTLTSEKASSKRIMTLAGIISSLVNVSFLALGITFILSELGVNLGPILAAAGVVGLAIGFGAQSLVKDILNGFFMVLEGQIRVGDWIRIEDGSRGQVEEITLRTLILRDLEGNVHIIPHGEITTVINMTKTWSQCQVDVGVAYRENADHVLSVLTEEADKLRNDPRVGRDILGPAEVLGITDFGDSAVIYRVRIKTATGRQWAVHRMYLLYIKRRFDADGIEIPYPHVTLYMGEDKEGNAPPLRIAKQDDVD